MRKLKIINEKYDSILVLESPLTVGFGEREDRVYGFVYNHNEWTEKSNHCWIEYLVGCKKWLDNGNQIDKDSKDWIEKDTNLCYEHNGEFVSEYSKQAYQETPICYFFKEGIDFDYTEDDVDGDYIKGERFWNWAIGLIDELYELEELYEEHWLDADESEDLPF